MLFLFSTSCIHAQNRKRNAKTNAKEFNFPKDSDLLKWDFKHRIFNESNFESVEFRKFADFSTTSFNHYADFEEISVDKGISFENDVFNDMYSIYRTIIPSNIRFNGSVFKGEARFEGVSCDSSFDFSNCTFQGDVNFIDVMVNKVNLSNLKLADKSVISFHNSQAIVLDFSFNPKISNEIRLVDAFGPLNPDSSKSPNPCLINLYRSDISKFYLDYHNFKLYFPPYHDETSNGDSTEISYDEKIVIYEALLNNFKLHGQADSYQLLDIEYKTFKYDSEKHWFYKWLDRYWWNFGYNKEYIFNWTGCLLLIFTFINMFFVTKLNNGTYLIESIPKGLSRFKSLTTFRALLKNLMTLLERFWYSLVYTMAIFFKVTLKIENFKFNNKVAVIYLFAIYIAGLVCLAYMANFVIQK